MNAKPESMIYVIKTAVGDDGQDFQGGNAVELG
jgi:hypothetical protein